MFTRLCSFFRRFRKAPSKCAPESLDAALRAEALEHARRLTGQGVSVRALYEGEIPSDSPEIDETPMNLQKKRP